MLVKYQNRIMALPMLCMIIIVLSACCFDEQKNETSNVNPKVQSVETVSVTRGNLTPTVSAHTTIIPALDIVALLGGLLPAIKAAKLEPALALR